MALPVTSRTAGQNIRSLDAVRFYQFSAFRLLIGRRPPFHIKNLFFWPDYILGMAMTFQTPFHL